MACAAAPQMFASPPSRLYIILGLLRQQEVADVCKPLEREPAIDGAMPAQTNISSFRTWATFPFVSTGCGSSPDQIFPISERLKDYLRLHGGIKLPPLFFTMPSAGT
jgi:hypothetical protein